MPQRRPGAGGSSHSGAQRTVARALSLAQNLFARRKVDSPALCAQLLLAETLGMERIELVLERERPLQSQEWRAFWRLASRRSLGEPAAYILGRKEFYGREFAVGPAVLTPRPETEHVVEAVLERFGRHKSLRFADLGTGSGILAVTLALELPRSRGLALDICPLALSTARSNAHSLHADRHLLFLQADMARAPIACASLDLLVANPPYVSDAEYQTLSHEVTRFEPRHALVPLADNATSGMENIAHVLQAGATALCSGGWLVLEMGHEQGPACLALTQSGHWREAVVLQDLAGRDRVLAAARL